MEPERSPTLMRRAYRRFAPVIMRSEGFEVTGEARPGDVPARRLVVTDLTKGGSRISMALRTSQIRAIKGNRNDKGRWRTIPNVDEVLVIVPAYGDPGKIEVLRFDSKLVIAALEAERKAHEARGLKVPVEQPILLRLDDKGVSKSATPGFKRMAKWSKEYSLSELMPGATPKDEPKSDSVTEQSNWLARMKREFAAVSGVDESQVVVDIQFRIR